MSHLNRITVNKLQRKPGTWQLRTNIASFGKDGRRVARLQHYQTFHGSEAQAEIERHRVLWKAKGRPATGARGDGSETVAEWAAQWLAAREAERPLEGAETARTRRNRVNLYVVRGWGHLLLAELRYGTVLAGARRLGAEVRERKGRPLSAQTVKHAVLALQAIVTDAAEAGKASLLACDFAGVKRTLLADRW